MPPVEGALFTFLLPLPELKSDAKQLDFLQGKSV
jgi:hypothetical protein